MEGNQTGSVDLKSIERLNGRHWNGDNNSTLPAGINFLNSVSQTQRILNRSRSSVYEMIAAGELKALKDGARLVITGESILERTKRLPEATIRKPAAA